jgi:hypothetical protein
VRFFDLSEPLHEWFTHGPPLAQRKITISIFSRQRVELLPYLVEVPGRIGTLGRGAAEANAGLVTSMLAIVGAVNEIFSSAQFLARSVLLVTMAWSAHYQPIPASGPCRRRKASHAAAQSSPTRYALASGPLNSGHVKVELVTPTGKPPFVVVTWPLKPAPCLQPPTRRQPRNSAECSPLPTSR